MFIVENGKITSEKTLDVGEIRRVDLTFKFTDTAFDDDDKFELDLGGNKFSLYGFTDSGCLRFTRCDLAEVITKAESNFSVSVLLNGTSILDDSITITAVVQGGGEEIQGFIYDNVPEIATTVQIIPETLTADVTSFSSMFSGCNALTSISVLDTSNGTSFSYMFYNCNALTSIPALDTSNGTSFSYMFYYCNALTSIPALDTSNGTNFQEMFYYCKSLTTIPPLDTSNGTNFSSMFNSCSALTDFGGLLNVKKSFYLSSATKLTHESLINTLNGLYDLTGGTAQTLTLGSTNLAKLTDQEKAIATNKNWVLA